MGKKKQRRGPGVSGDPRKRAGGRDECLAPGQAVAQPLTHVCGCRLSWSYRPGTESVRQALERLRIWLTGIAHLPCPMHGSASGIPAPPLQPGEARVLAQQGGLVSYRLCPEDRYEAADKTGEQMRGASSARRQNALADVWKKVPHQAAMAEHTRLSQGLGDEACFVCGDTEGTDWWRWTDQTEESLLCPDCVEIQQDMYSSGSGDHLVKVVRRS